jgi:hypothetical protein
MCMTTDGMIFIPPFQIYLPVFRNTSRSLWIVMRCFVWFLCSSLYSAINIYVGVLISLWLFLFHLLVVWSTTKEFFLDGFKKVEQWSHKCGAQGEYVVQILFCNPVACCSISKAKDLSAPHRTWRGIVGRVMNGELEWIWKDVVVIWSRYHPGLWLERQ